MTKASNSFYSKLKSPTNRSHNIKMDKPTRCTDVNTLNPIQRLWWGQVRVTSSGTLVSAFSPSPTPPARSPFDETTARDSKTKREGSPRRAVRQDASTAKMKRKRNPLLPCHVLLLSCSSTHNNTTCWCNGCRPYPFHPESKATRRFGARKRSREAISSSPHMFDQVAISLSCGSCSGAINTLKIDG